MTKKSHSMTTSNSDPTWKMYLLRVSGRAWKTHDHLRTVGRDYEEIRLQFSVQLKIRVRRRPVSLCFPQIPRIGKHFEPI